MKKIAIVQSNYIPWKGYFDLINMVDEFVIYDDMQYTRRDWRNRNKVKSPHGVKWLSIPVEVKGRYDQRINETIVSDADWSKKHWQTLVQYYSKTPFFKDYKNIFEEFYLESNERFLSKINLSLISIVCEILGITTSIRSSSEFTLDEGQTEKLLGICIQSEADVYVSGPAAKDYFDKELFEKKGIAVDWINYSGYKEYRQLNPPFDHSVTILDLLFNEGENANKFMKSFS